ncbi:MAG: hypothetical protein NTY32_10065 [Bacteroidia bacterium]|nr:hypothetical protein [Bacteroidia bacterium]
MKTHKINTGKKEYCTPQVECIHLDNEISLALESTPPAGPFEGLYSAPGNFNNTPLFFNNDLFISQIV